MENKKRRKKRSLTLIEVMIVILLIGLIGGALAFNMTGSMDQGRAFKTEQTMMRVHDILMMESALTGVDLNEVVENRSAYLSRSPLVKNENIDGMLKDGWNVPLSFSVANDDIVITSQKLIDFKNRHAAPQS